MNTTTKYILVSLLIGASVAGASAASAANDKEDRPDPWITLKTKIALLTDAAVSGTDINVDTVDGRVTLHGKVVSAEERKRAEEIATGITGAAEVNNLLQVVSEAKQPAMDENDEEIKQRVEAALEADPALKGSVSVKSVNNGVVLIAGEARSLSDHLRAVQSVRRAAGVRQVASEVKSPDGLTNRDLQDDMKSEADSAGKGVAQTLSDSWITTATKMRLLANASTPALKINVDTNQGVVTLFGVVPTAEAKQAAEAEASKVNGVDSVVNALQVVPESAQKTVTAKDEDVKLAVEAALQGRDDLKDVEVEVKNGVARLTGTVPASADSLQAALLVRSAEGVRSVKNDLRVATR